jgi:enamine deaminase RidA (YjgF/YER057c/UK114 family)
VRAGDIIYISGQVAGEADRLAVRRTSRCRVPLISTLQEQIAFHPSFGDADALQCRQPMDVICIAAVGVASDLSIMDCLVQIF